MVSEKILKEKAKKISILEGSAYSVSEGFGLRNVSAYALALGASNYLMSYFTSIPSLLGSLFQFLSYRIIKKTTRKKAVSFLVFLQSIFWILLIIPGLIFLYNKNLSNELVLLLIIFYTSLIILGSIAGPIWTSWMKEIVDEKELGSYFSKRNKITLIVVIISSLLAGLILDFFKNNNLVIFGFFILFFFSFLARFFSGYLFTKKYEPKYEVKKEAKFSFRQFLDNLPYNNFGKFVIFIASLNFFVAVAGPFFVVYLLKIRGVSYTLYASALFIMTAFSVLSMSFWGNISDKKGNLKIFKITLIGISLIPLIYFLSIFVENKGFFIFLVLMTEAVSGLCWGGFNLSSSNFVYKIVSKEKIIYCTTYLNVINGFAIFFGALLGGLIVSKEIPIINPVLLVFLISFLGRTLTYFFILPKVKEKKGFFNYKHEFFVTKILNVPRSFIDYAEQNLIIFKKVVSQIRLSKTS